MFNRIVGLKSGYDAGVGAGGKASSAATGKDGKVRKEPGGGVAAKAAAGSGLAPGSKPQLGEARSRAREEDPELARRFARYTRELGLAEEHADLLTGTRGAGEFFEAALAAHDDPAGVAAWVVTDVRGVLEGRTISDLPFDGSALGRLAALVADGSVSRRAAKDVLARMASEGGDPAALVEAMGLSSVSDAGELGGVVDEVLARWPDKVEEYRGGRKQLLGLFVGEVMKATRGAADPQTVRTLLSERLDT